MTEAKASSSSLVRKLGFQLALVLAVVLLPLTLISLLKSVALLSEVNARSEAALTGETMLAAGREMNLIQEARGAAAALAATLPAFLADNTACNAALRDFGKAHAEYSLVAFIPRDGMMNCSSTGKPHDFSSSVLFREVVEAQAPHFVVNRNGPVSGLSVLGVSHPVRDATGAYLGFVSLSLPHTTLRGGDPPGGKELIGPPLTLLTFDGEGSILTASGGLDQAQLDLPQGGSLQHLASGPPKAFTARTQDGEQRVFSVVPIVEKQLYALGSWPAAGKDGPHNLYGYSVVVFPALIWLASLGAAALAVEWLVLRHIRKLRRSIVSFAKGSRQVGDISMHGAPDELRDMADAYAAMTDYIIRDEAELEDTIHQKEALLRELHHRVKNNLQLIASIMNMQLRRARSPEARDMLRMVQDRVINLAAIHRELFQTTGVMNVHAVELLELILRQLRSTAAAQGSGVEISAELEDIRLTPDQAAPLALLVAEAVTSGVRAAALQGQGQRQVLVRLGRAGEGRASVEIIRKDGEGSAGVVRSGPEDDLGAQLVTAFAMQLGSSPVVADDGGEHRLSVEFPVRPAARA